MSLSLVMLVAVLIGTSMSAPAPEPAPTPEPVADPAPKPGFVYTQPVAAVSYASLQAHPPMAVSVKTSPMVAPLPLTYSYPPVAYAVNYPYVIL